MLKVVHVVSRKFLVAKVLKEAAAHSLSFSIVNRSARLSSSLAVTVSPCCSSDTAALLNEADHL